MANRPDFCIIVMHRDGKPAEYCGRPVRRAGRCRRHDRVLQRKALKGVDSDLLLREVERRGISVGSAPEKDG